MFPAQVVTHDRLARDLDLQWTIIIGVNKGLDEKKTELTEVQAWGFNDPVNTPAILAFRHKKWCLVICVKKN